MEWEEGGSRTACPLLPYRVPPPPPPATSPFGLCDRGHARFFCPSWTSPAAEPKKWCFFDMGPPALLFFSAAWHLPKVLILQSASA